MRVTYGIIMLRSKEFLHGAFPKATDASRRSNAFSTRSLSTISSFYAKDLEHARMFKKLCPNLQMISL